MAKLTSPRDIKNELRSACSTSVNELLYNFIGLDALHDADERDLLEYIKSVEVKSVHPEVYQQQFFVMWQCNGETIISFTARLKSQAMLCDSKRNCDCIHHNCTCNYGEDIIKSQLIAGINNHMHQSKVLSEMSTLPILTALLERLLTLESTEKASSHFRPSPDFQTTSQVAPLKSTYQRNKFNLRQPQRNPGRKTETPAATTSSPHCRNCRGCGCPSPKWSQTMP